MQNALAGAAAILVGMAALSLLEAAIPLRARGSAGRAHLGPNLALTALSLALNALLNGAILLALAQLERAGIGVLGALGLPPLAQTAAAVLALDFSGYLAHVALHRVPRFWRFHRVHHADPAVDVTTSLRQHPGEGLIRGAFAALCALPLGASPGAFAAYRALSALCALLEHANLRLPARLDGALSLVFTWPNLHKVHHARDARLTDSNYGNVVSWWDRLFGSFRPARLAAGVRYGLDGSDAPAQQTAAGLLALPFRQGAFASGPERARG